MMRGEKYPTSSSVIPVLDAIKASLDNRDEELEEVSTAASLPSYRFHQAIRRNMEKRFPNGNRTKEPFNALTLTDARYLDMHFVDEDEKNKAIETIIDSRIFDEEKLKDRLRTPATDVQTTPVIRRNDISLLENRRKALLLKKRNTIAASANEGNSVGERIREEVKQFLNIEPIDLYKNPLKWWKERESSYPLLAKFVKNTAHFQATSVASERIFNKDALIYTPLRSSILPKRSETLTFLQDFFTRRKDDAQFELCTECPGNRTKYKIQCNIH